MREHRRTLFGSPSPQRNAPPPRQHRSPSRSRSQSPANAMSQNSQQSSPRNSRNNSPLRQGGCSPPRQARNPPELHEKVTQLTQTVNAFVAAMALNQPPCAPQAPAPAQVPVPAPPPDFHWDRLFLPSPTNFPPATVDQVKNIATGLMTKLPLLTGRDRHEVEFVLTMLSDYENCSDQTRYTNVRTC